MLLARGPEMLSDGGGARPDGVEPVGGVDALGPHACLSAEDVFLSLLADTGGDVVVVEDLPGVVKVVEVPPAADDDVVALLDDGLHGRAAEPHVDDRALVDGLRDVRDHLLPVDGGAVEAEHQTVRAVHRVLVGVGGAHSALLHPLLDARRLQPAMRVHLVSAQMEEVVEEESLQPLSPSHLAEEAVEEVEDVLGGGVDGLGTGGVRTHLRIYRAPALHVARHVDLRHHADASLPRVLHQLPHVALRVALVRGVGGVPEAWVGERLQHLRLVVRQVPVQRVELAVRQRVDDPLHHRHRQEVPHRVDQQAAVLRLRGSQGLRGTRERPRSTTGPHEA